MDASAPPPAPPDDAAGEIDAPDPAPRKPWLEEEPRPGVEPDIGATDPAPPEPA